MEGGRGAGSQGQSEESSARCPAHLALTLTYHDHRGVGRGRWEELPVQVLRPLRHPLHLGHRQQHGGVLGFHRQHLALGVQRGDLLLVALDFLSQLLRKHFPTPVSQSSIKRKQLAAFIFLQGWPMKSQRCARQQRLRPCRRRRMWTVRGRERARERACLQRARARPRRSGAGRAQTAAPGRWGCGRQVARRGSLLRRDAACGIGNLCNAKNGRLFKKCVEHLNWPDGSCHGNQVM